MHHDPRVETATGRRDPALVNLEGFRHRLAQHPQCETCRKAPSSCGTHVRVVCRPCHAAELRQVPPVSRTRPPVAAITPPTPTRNGSRGTTSPTRLALGLCGYVLVWQDATRRERKGEPGNSFSESFRRGAFREFLATRPLLHAYINHDRARALASSADGLTLREDDCGLQFTMPLFDTPAGLTVLAAAVRGDIRGMSPNWNRRQVDFEWFSPMMRYREIVRTSLFEISVVLAPDWPTFRGGWAATDTPAHRQRLIAADLRVKMADLEAEIAAC